MGTGCQFGKTKNSGDDGGDGCTQMYLMSLDCAFKNGYDGKISRILHHDKRQIMTNKTHTDPWQHSVPSLPVTPQMAGTKLALRLSSSLREVALAGWLPTPLFVWLVGWFQNVWFLHHGVLLRK